MPNPFIAIINQVISEPQASLLNGILFGIRTNIPSDFYQALITTGTIHIVALSGQNISILVRIISEITLFAGRKLSLVLTFLTIVGFLLLVGWEPTIIRAAIMGSLSLLSVYFGRRDWSLLSLILAASIMLLVYPDWIDDLSFQLSFMATLGIILLAGKVSDKPQNLLKEIVRDLKINFRTTIAAQIFTLPLIFIYFRRISLVAPLTNILIGWTIGPIMILGFLTSFVGLFSQVVVKLFAWAAWALLTYLIYIVKLTAVIPFAAVKF